MFWTRNKVSSRSVILSGAVLSLAAIGLVAGAQFNSTVASAGSGYSAAAVAPSATFPANAGTLGAIPDAPVGGSLCGDYGTGFRDVTFTVTGLTAPLTDVQVSITGMHPWIGDLDAELRAPGNAATKLLFRQVGGATTTDCADDSDLGGPYVLNDTAPSTIWSGAVAAGSLVPVPAGSYRAVNPLMNTATPITPAFTGLSTAQINGTWTLRVRDGGEGDVGSITAASLILTGATGIAGDAPVDLNADGRTDYAVVRNIGGGATGQLRWYYNLSSGGPTVALDWGLASDFVLSEDFDNDNKDDVAVWRPGSAGVAAFYILNSATNTARVEAFGQTGDDPTVVDDYNNDGSADLAVYRDGVTSGAQSTWYYRTTPGGAVTFVPWGVAGDYPCPGDYDGNGSADFCVQRPTGGGQAAFWRRFSTGATDVVVFGIPDDVIVPGDYDGDGKTDVAVTRGVGGTINWYWRPSSGGPDQQVPFGSAATDFPVQGDYDGDGRTDQAVWRAGVFWVRNNSTGAISTFNLGAAGDFPVANFNTH